MTISKHEPYLGLNNLDLFVDQPFSDDEQAKAIAVQGTADYDPAAWDEVPYEPTLEEKHVAATPEELATMTRRAFHSGRSQYTKSLRASRQVTGSESQDTNQKLVLSIARYLLKYVNSNHRTPSPMLDISDRIQNANLYAANAATKYNFDHHGAGVSSDDGIRFIGFVTRYLDSQIRTLEADGKLDLGIRHGAPIRIPGPEGLGGAIYHRALNQKAALERYLGVELRGPEFRQAIGELSMRELQFVLGGVHDQDITAYEQYHIEYETLDGNEQVAAILDEDEIVNPERCFDACVLDFLNLDQRERDILDARLGISDGIPQTRQEVAEMHNITKERVGQIENQAYKNLAALPDLLAILAGAEVLGASEPITPLRGDESDHVAVIRIVLNGNEKQVGLLAQLKSQKITGNHIATQAGINRSSLSSLLTGRRRMSDEVALKILEAAISLYGDSEQSVYELVPGFAKELDALLAAK